MKVLLVVVLAILATVSGHCLKTQKLETCAKSIIKQAEIDVNPICNFTFDSLRALVKIALETNTLVDPEETIQIATGRLFAVVSAAAAALNAVLGTDANMILLYTQLLEDVLQIIRKNIAWVNRTLSDKSILLSKSIKLRLLDDSIAYAQINGHNLNLNLQVTLEGYVNGALKDAVIKIAKNTLIKPICHETFDALRAASLIAFATRIPLSATAIITKSSGDLSVVVGNSAKLIEGILVIPIPYAEAHNQLLADVVVLINQTVDTINEGKSNPFSSFSSDDATALITKCQDDSHALYENVVDEQVPGFLFSSLADDV